MDLSKYERGSYNRVNFFTPTSSTSGGPKSVVHDYPKSPRKEVEFMGKNQKSFTLSCIIYGQNYYELKRNFTEQLDKGEYGNLIHPIEGQLRVAVLNYTIDESESNLGIAMFRVVFQEVTDKTEPDQAASYDGKISAVSNKILVNSKSFVADIYKTTFGSSYQDAASQLLGITDSIEENTSELLGDQDVKNDLNAIFTEVRAKPFSSIETSDVFYSLIEVMMGDLALLGSGISKFEAYKSLFSSGDDIVTSSLTVSQSEAKANTDVINTIVQTQALMYAYEATQNIDFVLYQDLKSKQDDLEAQYSKVYSSLDGSLKSDLDELRNLLNSYYLTLNVYDLIEVKGNGQSLNVLCYRYYGNLDFFDIIKELNNISNVAFIDGTIRIPSNVTF